MNEIEMTIENTLCPKCFHPIIEHNPFFGCVYGPDTNHKRCGCIELDATQEFTRIIKENESLKAEAIAAQNELAGMRELLVLLGPYDGEFCICRLCRAKIDAPHAPDCQWSKIMQGKGV